MDKLERGDVTSIILSGDVSGITKKGAVRRRVETVVVCRGESEEGQRAALEGLTERVAGVEAQQSRYRELIALDPERLRQADGLIHDEAGVRRSTERARVVCVLYRACTGLEAAVEELVERPVRVHVWFEQLVKGDVVRLDEGRDVCRGLWRVVDRPLPDALFPQKVLHVHGFLQHPDLLVAIEHQMHAQAHEDGHAFEHTLVRAPHGDKVSNVVLVGELLELRDELVQPWDA